MEHKLREAYQQLPAPRTEFAELEAMARQPKRVKKLPIVLAAALLVVMLCGFGWARARKYGLWSLGYSRSWTDAQMMAEKYDVQLPQQLDGVSFLLCGSYTLAPSGANHTQALLNRDYVNHSVDYGWRVRTEDTVYMQEVLGLSFGTTENPLWRYYFQFDENDRWTAGENVELLEYKGNTLQIGTTSFYDESQGTTRTTWWVYWLDGTRHVVFSLNETDAENPDRLVECAKQIIDINAE